MPALRVAAEARGVSLDDAFRVPLRDRRGVGIATIEQQLHLRLSVTGEYIAGKIRGDHHAQQRAARIHRPFNRAVTANGVDDLKITRALEIAHQLGALRTAIHVVNDSRDAVNIQAQCIAENQQHNERNGDGRGQAARIADHMQHFLAGDSTETAETHAAALSSCSMRLTKTSSIEGVMGSRTVTEIPARSSVWRIHEIARSASSTLICKPPPNTATS